MGLVIRNPRVHFKHFFNAKSNMGKHFDFVLTKIQNFPTIYSLQNANTYM
jgi:hypothetical protein